MKNKVNRHEQAAPSEDSTDSPQADALRPSSVQAGQALRKKAEEIARRKTAQSSENLEAMSPEEVRQTLHELQVHQIELEMQNEELRRAQEELEAARARYFDLFDLAPIGYFTVSEAGLIMEVNLTAANMLGVTRGSLVKQPLTRFILPEDRDIYYRRRKLLFETGAPQMCEMRMVKKDAAPFWAQMEARLAQNAEGAPVCHAVVSDISARKRAEVELQQVRDELEHRVTERTEALRRANEELRTDIINRKRAEKEVVEALQQLQETSDMLIQSEKHAAVGRLAVGVAHEILNPASIISSRLQFMEEDNLSEPVRENVRVSREQLQRIVKISHDLLQSSTKKPTVLVGGDLRRVIEAGLQMTERRIKEDHIQVEYNPSSETIPVKMEKDRLVKVIVSLILNACDAMTGEHSKQMIIAVYRPEVSSTRPSVRLIVTDNGHGIHAGELDKIFEPFFTRKDPGKGTGLGLSVSKGIIQEHGGTIHAENNDMGGASLIVELPLDHP
jgi:PAS domain S-box-containing protein